MKEKKCNVLRETTMAKDGYTYKYTLCYEGAGGIYSLKIVMTGEEGETYQSTASVAMSDEWRAIDFYSKLVRNLATPKNLAYCIEDERL